MQATTPNSFASNSISLSFGGLRGTFLSTRVARPPMKTVVDSWTLTGAGAPHNEHVAPLLGILQSRHRHCTSSCPRLHTKSNIYIIIFHRHCPKTTTQTHKINENYLDASSGLTLRASRRELPPREKAAPTLLP